MFILLFICFYLIFKFLLLFLRELNDQLLVVGFRLYTLSGWFVGGGEHRAGEGRREGWGYASPCRLFSTLCSQGCLLCGPQALGLWRVEYHLLIYHGWWWEGLKTQEHKDSAKRKNKTRNNQTHTYTHQRKTNRHTDNRNQMRLDKKKGRVL